MHVSAAWYTSTYVAATYLYIHVNLLSPSARGTTQPTHVDMRRAS